MLNRKHLHLGGLSFEADLAYVGRYCTQEGGFREFRTGFIHFVRAGEVLVEMPGHPAIVVTKPSLVFFPRPHRHRILARNATGADLVCANTRFLGSQHNPLSACFPDILCMELEEVPEMRAILEIFFAEALGDDIRFHSGEVLEKLCVVLLIYMTRRLIEQNRAPVGFLAGLRDKHIAAALNLVHRDYGNKSLTLQNLVGVAEMSRSHFCSRFREVVGYAPGEYLALYRMAIAQKMLASSSPVKSVASMVGYRSTSAFSRKFKTISGVTPAEWRTRTE